MKKGNLITALITFLLGGYVIVAASGFPKAEAYGTGVPGPGLWPILISGVMIASAVVMVIKTLYIKKEDDTPIVLWNEHTRRVYICIAIILAYIVVLPKAGFIISTVVMLSIFIQWFSKYKIYITLIVSVVSTLVVYSCFRFLLNVPIHFGLFSF